MSQDANDLSPGEMLSDYPLGPGIVGIAIHGDQHDVIGHIEEKDVLIKAPSTYGAVLFEGEGNEGYKNIVMPIRV